MSTSCECHIHVSTKHAVNFISSFYDVKFKAHLIHVVIARRKLILSSRKITSQNLDVILRSSFTESEGKITMFVVLRVRRKGTTFNLVSNFTS